VSKVVAILLLLALFGASTQCVADCLTQPTVPPCHKHAQSKSCDHLQLVAYTQALCPPAVEIPSLIEIAFEHFTPEAPPFDNAPSALSVLRL
jgi:hypothetical protein